jgi:hypothetical protein
MTIVIVPFLGRMAERLLWDMYDDMLTWLLMPLGENQRNAAALITAALASFVVQIAGSRLTELSGAITTPQASNCGTLPTAASSTTLVRLLAAATFAAVLLVALSANSAHDEVAQGVTAKDNSVRILEQSWAQTLAKSGLAERPRWAVLSAACRLIFFHCLQPLAYVAALDAYWTDLDGWQRTLGVAVAVREVVYLICCLLLAALQPSYLLTDVGATWREEKFYAMLYVLAPEKLVFAGLSILLGSKFWLIGLGSFVCDLAGIGALVAALAAEVTPAPLIFGYVCVTVAAVVFVLSCGGCMVRWGLQEPPTDRSLGIGEGEGQN